MLTNNLKIMQRGRVNINFLIKNYKLEVYFHNALILRNCSTTCINKLISVLYISRITFLNKQLAGNKPIIEQKSNAYK